MTWDTSSPFDSVVSARAGHNQSASVITYGLIAAFRINEQNRRVAANPRQEIRGGRWRGDLAASDIWYRFTSSREASLLGKN
jgi:hypothetical protein